MNHGTATIRPTGSSQRVRPLAIAAATALAVATILAAQANAAPQSNVSLPMSAEIVGPSASTFPGLAVPTSTPTLNRSSTSPADIAATEKRIEAERDQATVNFVGSAVAAGVAFGMGAAGGTSSGVGAAGAAAVAATPSPTPGIVVRLR
jgi:hypothetical protein